MDSFRATTSPWYEAGLAFECVCCGRCCAGPEEGYVWVSDKEAEAIARFLGISDHQMRRRYVRKVRGRISLVERKDNHDCVFLIPDGKGRKVCRVYAVRPTQCRTWPFWPQNLSDADAWSLAATRCPGINRGPLFGVEQIEAQRNATCC